MKKAVFPVGLAIAFVLVNLIRIYQLVVLTDPITGFYYDKQESLATLLTFVILGIAVVLIALSIITKQRNKIAMVKPNDFLGISQIMLGVSFAVEPLFILNLPATVPQVLQTIKTALIFTSGATFIVLGFLNFIGKKPNYILTIVPTLSYIARVLVTFICYTGMSGISQNHFEIINLCCILAFLHYSSKILCNVSTKRTSLLTCISAVAAILSATLCSIPTMVAKILGFSGNHVAVDSIITNLFIVIYIVAFLISKKQEAETNLENSEINTNCETNQNETNSILDEIE